MLVNHLGYSVSQQHNILVKRLDLSLKLDAVDEINGNWDMLAAQSIEEGVLKKLTFIAHDILRVQECCCKPAPYHSRAALCGSRVQDVLLSV